MSQKDDRLSMWRQCELPGIIFSILYYALSQLEWQLNPKRWPYAAWLK